MTKFKLILLKKGISQSELSKQTGVCQTHISAYALGKSDMSAKKLYRIAKYLNVKVIIDDDEFNRKKERITKLIQEAQRELDTFSDVIEVRI